MTDGSTWWVESGQMQRQFDYARGVDGTFGAGVDTGLVQGTIAAAPAGEYRVELALVLRGTVTAGGTASIRAGTGATPPAQRTLTVDVTASPSPRTFLTAGVPFTWGGGDLTVSGSVIIGAGTTTIYAAGSYICATYLGPR